MAKAKIGEDAAVERAIDEALAAGRRVVIGGLDPSMSGMLGRALITVDCDPRAARATASRGGTSYPIAVREAAAEPAQRDPWGQARDVLHGASLGQVGAIVIACEEQYVGAGVGSAMKVLEARVRLLYAFERQAAQTPHIMVLANPMTWHSKVLGPKRWTRDEVKAAASKFASNLAGYHVEGDAADALGIAAHTLARFFTIDLGRFR